MDRIAKYAKKCHQAVHQLYDGEDYYDIHVVAVVENVIEFKDVFREVADFEVCRDAAKCHDLIEDAHQTYRDILDIAGEAVADVTFAVTDVPGETRLLRALNTLPKTIKDYRAIVLKLCDIAANAAHGKETGGSMFRKYQKEWPFKRYVFEEALKQVFTLDRDKLQDLFEFVDFAHMNPIKKL